MIRFRRVKITGGFLLLVAWMNYFDQQQIVPMALLACALHEMGHLAVIHWFDINIKEINITATGAEIVSDSSSGYCQDGIAALAGPATNLLAALLFSKLSWGALFSGINLVLACFNLLPIGTLDGGRALHATLSLLVDQDITKWIGIFLDTCFIGTILLLGSFLFLRGRNITLLLIGVWMLSSAVRAKEGN